jgi:ureidoglycolate lyase
MKHVVQPLTAEAFAPFGQVFTPPAEPGRIDDAVALDNRRAKARPMLLLATVPPSTLPLTAVKMERHPYSSQTFVPMGLSRYLVVVAPKDAQGNPDVAQVRAFVATAEQGVSYNADTWHHPVTVLDAPARFAVFMWNDGSSADTEWHDLSTPFEVCEPE